MFVYPTFIIINGDYYSVYLPTKWRLGRGRWQGKRKPLKKKKQLNLPLKQDKQYNFSAEKP